MAETTQSALLSLVDELLMLIHETAEYHRQESIREVLGEARQIVLNVRRRLRTGSGRYVVAMVGLTNVGKSTLLNALLGEDFAPRRNGPCTAVPVEFVHGPELRLTVLRHQRLHRDTWACSTTKVLHQHLQELADDQGAETSQGIRKVVVEVPHPLLASGLVIADTPGFGAAQTGDAAGTHEQALKTYLQDDVAQVFWVVLADQGIGRREQQFHRLFLSDVCDDVLVTGSEDWGTRDRDRFRQRFAHELGQRLPRFHFVSGLQGSEARRATDVAGLEQAGITALEKRLGELADQAGRQSAQVENLLQLARDIATWSHGYHDESGLPVADLWRPDSWARWISLAPNVAPKNALTRLLEASP